MGCLMPAIPFVFMGIEKLRQLHIHDLSV